MKKKKRGRPPKSEDELHSESLLVRLDANEKQAFKDAAKLAGVSLSAWARERLRQIATRELKSAAQPIAFMKQFAHD
jgi:predicted HicB family RNase H-like nuclease